MDKNVEKVEKFRIAPEQIAWLQKYKSLRKGLEAVAKMLPKNPTEAQFLQQLINEVAKERETLIQNLPKDRVKELHNQPTPEELDRFRINY